MTTAHRPTFDPARGKDSLRGPGYHQRLLPAHKTLKFRQATQGTTDEHSARDLRAELLRAERRHFAKKEGRELSPEEEEKVQLAIGQGEDGDAVSGKGVKRSLAEGAEGQDGEQDEEDYEAKRRRVLEETRDVDADSEDGSEEDSDSSDDESDDDEEAELMRELAKIKAERAEAAAREAAEQAAKEEEENMKSTALGNPLLQPKGYEVKRRWDDDVVFKNQARGTEDKKGKEFVNDLLRSDFHRRFMSKYVR
ncbi:Cwf15/Cwc15 cell cycle control protein [Aureobasidium subglaciale]|nr:Cwf15/Cwc15 cell cycle control protein [Aureobasidium subglaciale]KAI5272827.1 Cwf15/Cwc15 cell cycle control protein [Aureobasidium subglaciale]